MKNCFKHVAIVFLACLFQSTPTLACGGLFCQTVPVDQAGEQILFHQDGDDITAMVRILYEGDSENFSWVVPVPSTPELSTGADTMFDELEQLTSPRFVLDVTGNQCDFPIAESSIDSDDLNFSAGESTADSGGVVIEESLSVGPFDIDIVSSTSPDEMATWLVDNNYDLSDRGRELITPYVDAGMKFVAVKLRSGQSSGSIQPLIMKYKSSEPMVPITLTSVAALEDMGVLVWLVSDARAVPSNYLHVVPNYTQLNWYTGIQNAYASYQGLITSAMNEAGGQGFATDFAGVITGEITDFMSSPEMLELELQTLDRLVGDSDFLSTLYTGTRSDGFRSAVESYLPLPAGQDASVYASSFALSTQYTAEQLLQARNDIRQGFVDIELDPLRNSTALLPDGRYLTRLYTTLSADEMTVDPIFQFNADMETQSRERRATMHLSCMNDVNQWSLTLGAGTGREGEEVIVANTNTPFFPPIAVNDQSPVFNTSITSRSSMPVIETQNEFAVLKLNTDGTVSSENIDGVNDTSEVEGTEASTTNNGSGNKFLGGVSLWWLSLIICIRLIRRRSFEL